MKKPLLQISTLFALCFQTLPVFASEYTFSFTPSLSAIYDDGYAVSINNVGQVLYYSFDDNLLETRSLVYEHANQTFKDIHIPSYGLYSINDYGEIPGSQNNNQNKYYAALYTNNSWVNLGTLTGHVNSEAFDVNNSGQVVGLSNNYDNNLPSFTQYQTYESRAFLYSNGTMQDLGTIGGTRSFAGRINESGQVIGASTINSRIDYQAFLYDNGNMQNLGALLNKDFSIATDINDAGQVIGYSYNQQEQYIEGDALHSFLYTNGTMRDLGAGIAARAINNAGQIVGNYEMIILDNGSVTGDVGAQIGLGERGAFLFEDGSFFNLNSFLDQALIDDGWTISTAYDINDAGWIVGKAVNNDLGGISRGYILSISAVPEPETYAMFLIGLCMLGFNIKRRANA